jgi:hypothetical protein
LKKRFKENIIRLILNPFIIAIPFALITILLLPFGFDKIKLLPVSDYNADKIGKQTMQYYKDLNNDSVDEEISHFINDIGQCAIKVTTREQVFKGQWNFNGTMQGKNRNLLYLDINKDGILDIFTVFQRNDSVFLGGVNPEIDSAFLIKELFVDRVNLVNGRTDFSTELCNADLNNDGHDEILIIIAAGFSEQPRRIYAFDFLNNTLKASPVVGFLQKNIIITDPGRNGYPELIPMTISYENIEEHLGIPYHDYDRWFVTYNHNLEFEFGPVKLGPGNGTVRNYIFENDSSTVVIILDSNNESVNKYTFYEFEWRSKKLRKIRPDINTQGVLKAMKYQQDDETYLIVHNRDMGSVIMLDPFDSLSVVKRFQIETGLNLKQQIDIDSNGENEFIFSAKREGKECLYIYSNDFKYNHLYHIPQKFSVINNISKRRTDKNHSNLVLQLDENLLEFEYLTDRYYLVKALLLYIAIYGFYLMLIWMIMHYQKKYLKKRYLLKQQLAELKLKTIRSQLDPHFTFNAINAISSSIMKEDKKVAYNYFSLFSRLMRSTMLYSDRLTRLLSDELDFTRDYLNIEKFRFREKFDYHINVAPDVNLYMEVPRMIIQTFAESAVSNGLMHRTENGELRIDISNSNKNLIVLFKDNGVGIEKSKILNKEKAFKAIKIMDEFIRIFNNLNQTNISYKMYDLNLSEEFPGTAVEVNLPPFINQKPDNL